jgi:signal transduction histidine kinase
MNWITVICSMIAASCLTVAGIHLLVWLRSRRAWTNLLLANCALSAAVIVGCNIALMHASSVAHSAALLRWMYVPLTWGVISLMLFVRQYLNAGRTWLVWCVLAVRAIALVLNFAMPVGVILRDVTTIQTVSILGERVTIPVGPTNPWMLVGNVGVVLILVFFVDASLTAGRQGRRKEALVIGGILVPTMLIALIRALLMVAGGPSMPTPYFISLVPLGVMLVMSFSLSGSLLRGEALARELRESHERMGLATRELDRVSRLTAMGEFAAALAHETIQPITAMILEAKSSLRALPETGPGIDEVRVGLLSVVESGERAAEMLQRNRELFRHRTVRTVPLDMNEVIGEARSLAGWRLNDSNVSIEMSLTRNLPVVSGDRVELQQVLLNLIGNAIDAVESRANPKVWIRSSHNGNEVRIEVGDNGIGLGEVDTLRMFSLSYTTKPNGTGVGLSVSRAIVDAHRGRIWAEPNPEGGASFLFTLPRRRSNIEPELHAEKDNGLQPAPARV